MTTDNSTRILVAVDASNFAYTCVHSAARKWEESHPDEAEAILKPAAETDQDNLPDLLNVDSFRRKLSFVVQDKLAAVVTILQNNHYDEVVAATGMDIVFAMDDRLGNSFRKRMYPAYKAQRRVARQRYDVSAARDYVLNVIFRELNIEEGLGYMMVKVPGCECDDVIATLMKNHTGYLCRVIISADRDFLQIPDVSQYNIWGEKIERTIKDVSDGVMSRADYLLWKVIRGDVSDNIRSVFDRYGEKKSYALVLDRPRLTAMLKESNDAAERFRLNMSLIDFRKIPSELENAAEEELSRKIFSCRERTDFNLEGCMVV